LRATGDILLHIYSQPDQHVLNKPLSSAVKIADAMTM
jgi:hypothetical protein